MRALFQLVLLCASLVALVVGYEESITVRPLSDGHVSMHFEFALWHDGDLFAEASHFTHFPKPLGQLVHATVRLNLGGSNV